MISMDPVMQFQKIAKQNFDINIQQKEFMDIEWSQEFDGIWANASLLHVSYEDHPKVFQKFHQALKSDGVLYCSYKYGEGHMQKTGRDFYSFQEKSFTSFIEEFTSFKILKLYKDQDQRVNRAHEYWLNALIQKF